MKNATAILIVCLLCGNCNNTDTITETPSSDSSLKAIDPSGSRSDTEHYLSDSVAADSARGLTH